MWCTSGAVYLLGPLLCAHALRRRPPLQGLLLGVYSKQPAAQHAYSLKVLQGPAYKLEAGSGPAVLLSLRQHLCLPAGTQQSALRCWM